jgi:hypothetical protein
MFLNANDLDLYGDMSIDKKEEIFFSLSMEDQYRSYINSFRPIKDPRNRQLYWARCLAKFGRELLPLIDDDIRINTFNYLYTPPYDTVLSLIAYILQQMKIDNILTDVDKSKYRELYGEKIEEYIIQNKIIDRTVIVGIICIENMADTYINVPRDLNALRDYYEKKLGINGLQVVE